MEHPLIKNIDSLSLEELQTNISDLSRKYAFAMRTNADLARQIGMALETFRNKYYEKEQAVWQTANKDSGFSDKINIS